MSNGWLGDIGFYGKELTMNITMDTSLLIQVSPTQSAATDRLMGQSEEDMMTKLLLTRIKNARLARATRDSLSALVRSVASEGGVDHKAFNSISATVTLMETMNRGYARDREFDELPRERTVDDEMSRIVESRSRKRAAAESARELQNKFSTLA